ncbi:MAG: aminotransferase, class superfamily, partial [Patescibacteria group bacterium]|nr:aminotransferase, class superfamily [Patescibacteria group bacterium]
SRKSVAKLLGTTSEHVVFTRGGTESNNIGVLGVIEKYKSENPEKVPHIIISEIEHAAVLETAKYLESQNKISLSIAPVDAEGIVDMKELKKLLCIETVLVSIMYVNNEIGTIQPIKEITKLVRWFKKQNDLKTYPLVHTDAIQAANYLDINVERLGVDLMSLSGSKIYGPKSSGVLYVRNKNTVSSMFHGGDQEFGLRSGTEDIAQIVGFSKAFELARKDSEQESKRLGELQSYFFSELAKNIPDAIVNGSLHERICNNINITITGISGERLVIELDAKGISAASKSACKEDNGEESHVIAAIRRADDRFIRKDGVIGGSTDGSLRFTMGKGTTKRDVEKAVVVLAGIIKKIRVFEAYLTK